MPAAFELKTSTIKVRDVIDAAAHGLRERLKQGSVELQISIAADVDTLVADGRRVTQILYNLLSNAIGSSPQGEAVVLNCSRDHSRLAFTVEDKGCGIPTEYQPFVFDRFESRTLGSRRRGAGLGLALVKSLVELHGGTVALASEPGRGTWVRVLLPLQQAEQRSLAEQSYRSSRAG